MIVGRSDMGAVTATLTVDPIMVNGQAVGDAPTITGEAPSTLRTWLPWIIAAAALGAAWWYASRDEEEGSRESDRPFDG